MPSKSSAKKPVAKKPVAKKPVAKKPVAKKPVAKKPGGLRVTASMSASEIYVNRMPGPGGPRPPVPIKVSLQVRNEGTEVITFTFGSAKRFDIEVSDGEGRIVTTWSSNKRFAAGVQAEALAPRRSLTVGGEVAIGDRADVKLTAGPHTVSIYLSADRAVRVSLPLSISFAY